jgi:MATE family multidrug resistance protein
MIASRAGLASMGLIDCVMVAHYDTRQLAFINLAEGTFGRLVDICVSVLVSGLVLIAGAYVKHDVAGARRLWQRSLVAAAGLGGLGALIGVLAPSWLGAIPSRPELMTGASQVIVILSLGLPAGLVAVASAVYLEASHKATSVALFVIAANLANLLLDFLLIGGHLGIPAMGAVGSAAATSLVRLGLALALGLRAASVSNVSHTHDHQAARHGAEDADRRNRQLKKDQWILGLNAAAMAGGMHALAIWLTILAAWLGPGPLAAFSACWLLTLPGMLMASGFGDAIAIRVAQPANATAQNRRFFADLRSLGLAMIPFFLGLWLLPQSIARLFTTDEVLAGRLAHLLPFAAFAFALDGISYALVSALRGKKDVLCPTLIMLICMASTPVLAFGLAVTLQQGVVGIVTAIVSTSTVRMALLSLRFAIRHARAGPSRPFKRVPAV